MAGKHKNSKISAAGSHGGNAIKQSMGSVSLMFSTSACPFYWRLYPVPLLEHHCDLPDR